MPTSPFRSHSAPRRRHFATAGAVIVLGVMIAMTEHRRGAEAAVLRADPETILADTRLRRIALAGGAPIYAAHCAACHGAAGKGDQHTGVPDLTDDDHLYGTGRVAEIEELARHGIRAQDRRGANLASMPAYGRPVPYKGEKLPSLTPAQIEDLTQGLLSFTGRATNQAAARRGLTLYHDYAVGCWDCHGTDAGGDGAIGAPTLSDDKWLYGGGHAEIRRTLSLGRAGMSPAFARVLTPVQLRDVAVYVASLETGERSPDGTR